LFSQQKKFLTVVTITCAAIVASFWAAAANLRMGFMPQEYAMWLTRKDLIDRCQLAPIIIQGDSRPAAGLLPSHIGGATNLAFGGASPVETFYAAQSILKCDRSPRRVLLSISPALFTTSSYFWDRTVLFGFLTYDQLEEIRSKSRTFQETMFYQAPKFGDWDAILENWLHSVSFPSYYTSYMVNHLILGRLKVNTAVKEETQASSGQHSYGLDDGSSDVADDAAIREFRPSPMFNYYLERLLEDYAKRGTRVDFVALPINRSTFDKMNPQVISDFHNYLYELTLAHQNFHILGPAIAELDDNFFGDSSHLNKRGAILFSDKVNAMLESQAGQ
jgi:hypothetical protein